MAAKCLLIVALLRLAIASDNPGSHTNNDVNVDNSKDDGDIDAVYNGHIVQNRKLQAITTNITAGSVCPQKRKCLKQDGASCVQKGKCDGIISRGCSQKCDCCTPAVFFSAPGLLVKKWTLFTGITFSWDDAVETCKDHNMVLAETEDPLALRTLIATTSGYNTHNTWLGGKSDGVSMRWLSDNQVIPSWRTNPNWYPGQYRTEDSYLLLITFAAYVAAEPTKPLWAYSEDDTAWALCEKY